MHTKEKQLSTRYPFDILNTLKALAREHNRSFNGEVVWALRQYIAQQQEKEVLHAKSIDGNTSQNV